MRSLLIGLSTLSICVIGLSQSPKPDDKAKPEEQEKVKWAKQDVQTLEECCKVYKLLFDKFPEKLEQLVRPPKGGPLLEKDEQLIGPWNKKYEYDVKGPKNGGKKPDIWCVTPDGKKIGNWPDDKR